MAGKRTGGGTPQGTVGRVARRGTIWGALDNRRTAEQDVREIKFVRPRGSSGAIIVNPGGGQEGYAANLLGKTLRPGTTALALSKSGEGGDNIIPASAVGRKGAIPATPSRRPYATPAAATPNQYAFGDDGVDLYAMLYADGTYVSTRATIPTITLFGATACGCLITDASEIVGDGSLLMTGSGDHYVWDVENAATYTYAVPAGWKNPTNLYYQNGYLYWVEIEDIPTGGVGVGDATFDYRLRRSATDLSSVTTVLTVTSANANTYGAPYTIYEDAPTPIAFAVDEDGAVLYMGFLVSESTNHEIAEWHGLQVRFALSGSAANRAFFAPEMAVDGFGTPVGPHHAVTVGGASYAIAAVDNGVSSIVSKGDDASAGPSNLWGASDLDDVLVAALSVGSGGSVIQAHSAAGIIVRGIASGVVIASSVDAFDGTNSPSSMFYFGV
jgi:hypothetical protein